VETSLLILNTDPVFQDRSLAIFDEMDAVEIRIVRSMSEAIGVLLSENFDGFIVEGEPTIALDQATNARQHFPSLRIACVVQIPAAAEFARTAGQQKIVATDAVRWFTRQTPGRSVGRDRPVPFVDWQFESIFRGRNSANELSWATQRAVHL